MRTCQRNKEHPAGTETIFSLVSQGKSPEEAGEGKARKQGGEEVEKNGREGMTDWTNKRTNENTETTTT